MSTKGYRTPLLSSPHQHHSSPYSTPAVVTAACGVSGQSPHASLRTVTRAHRHPSTPTSATATSPAAPTMHALREIGGAW